MEQEGLGDIRSLLGLVHKLFLPYCALCQENELPAKMLLLLDIAPGHHAKHAEVRTPLDGSVYVPLNTTSLCNQWVIATLKAYYFYQALMEKMRVLDRSDKTEGLLVLMQRFEGH
jgi:hypothetical protein